MREIIAGQMAITTTEERKVAELERPQVETGVLKEQQRRQNGWSWAGSGALRHVRWGLLLPHNKRGPPTNRAPFGLGLWHPLGLEHCLAGHSCWVPMDEMSSK